MLAELNLLPLWKLKTNSNKTSEVNINKPAQINIGEVVNHKETEETQGLFTGLGENYDETFSDKNHLAEITSLNQLKGKVATCQLCRLCESRTQTVFGFGDEKANWLFIGEAPGENEDKLGEPFVGAAGKLLDNILQALQINRHENVYIANVIKCRPPGNRNPMPNEIEKCEPYLKKQIDLIQPKILIALGRFAAQTLLKTDKKIGSLRLQKHDYQNIPVVVTYHPAYLLRNLSDKSKAWEDMLFAKKILLGLSAA